MLGVIEAVLGEKPLKSDFLISDVFHYSLETLSLHIISLLLEQN